MSFIFKMPDVGEGIAEGEIVQWFVKVGDTVKEDQPLLEIANDKLVQEVPSPVSGTIKSLLVEAGTVANVGDDLLEIETGDASHAAPAKEEVKSEAKTESKAASANFVFNLPDVGEGLAEAEVVQWFVKVGDTVTEDQAMLEIQTDKLVQEVPAPVSGTIAKINVEAGSVATVGDALVEISTDGSVSTETAAPAQTATSNAPAATDVVNEQHKNNSIGGNVLALPSVRRYAREKGVDLTQVNATGKHGHVRLDDVNNFLENGSTVQATETASTPTVEKTQTAKTETKASAPKVQTPSAPVVTKGSVTREKMTPTRRAISNAMLNSKSKAPHVTLFDEVEVSELMSHRNKFKTIAASQDVKLTFLPYVVKALVSVARKFPILNSSVDDTTEEIVYKNYFNVGFAADTPHGLYVPNIKDTDTKGMFTIAKEITELATAANDGSLKGPDMRDGTITISNIGSARGLWFTPIINYPEVAILGVGRIDKKPIVLEDGTIGVGQMMALSLSFDHRVIDGALAQNAMNELKRLLANPELLLMEG